jgi:hypothetical protein
MPQKKESLALRLDHDVLVWFRGTGRGYQTKMNAILRSYMRSATQMTTNRRTNGCRVAGTPSPQSRDVRAGRKRKD